MLPLHTKLKLSDLHGIQALEFADQTQLKNAILNNLVDASDIGKVARQLDDNSYWVLNSKPVKAYHTTYVGTGTVTTMFYNTNADRDLALPTVASVKLLVGENYVGHLFVVEKQAGKVWYIPTASTTDLNAPVWAMWATPLALTSAEILADSLIPSDLNDTNKGLVWNTSDDTLNHATVVRNPEGSLVWTGLTTDTTTFTPNWDEAIANGNYFDNHTTLNRPGSLTGSYFGTTFSGRKDVNTGYVQTMQTVYHFTGGLNGHGSTRVWRRRNFINQLTQLQEWSTWIEGQDVISFKYSTASQRTAANLQLDDIGKIIKQEDDGSFWIVSDVVENGISPGVNTVTWAPLGVSGGSNPPVQVANEAQRQALVLSALDLGRLVYQQDIGEFFLVEDLGSPVANWTPILSGIITMDFDADRIGATNSSFGGSIGLEVYSLDTKTLHKLTAINGEVLTWADLPNPVLYATQVERLRETKAVTVAVQLDTTTFWTSTSSQYSARYPVHAPNTPILTPNSSARTSKFFIPKDIGSLVHQQDTNSYWIVEDKGVLVGLSWVLHPNTAIYNTEVERTSATVESLAGITTAFVIDTKIGYTVSTATGSIVWTELRSFQFLDLGARDAYVYDLVDNDACAFITSTNKFYTLKTSSIGTKLLSDRPIIEHSTMNDVVKENFAGSFINHYSPGNNSLTFPPSSVLSLPIGTEFEINNQGNGSLTFIPGGVPGEVTLESELGLTTKETASNTFSALVKAVKVSGDTWKLTGDLTGKEFPIRASLYYTTDSERTANITSATTALPKLGTIAKQVDAVTGSSKYWVLKTLTETSPTSGIWNPTWVEIGGPDVVAIYQVGGGVSTNHYHTAVVIKQNIDDAISQYDGVMLSSDFVVPTSVVTGHSHEITLRYTFATGTLSVFNVGVTSGHLHAAVPVTINGAAQNIVTTTDWNTAITDGSYQALSNAANGPTTTVATGGTWTWNYVGVVYKDSADNIIQVVKEYDVVSSGGILEEFTRVYSTNRGSWSPWVSSRTSSFAFHPELVLADGLKISGFYRVTNTDLPNGADPAFVHVYAGESGTAHQIGVDPLSGLTWTRYYNSVTWSPWVLSSGSVKHTFANATARNAVHLGDGGIKHYIYIGDLALQQDTGKLYICTSITAILPVGSGFQPAWAELGASSTVWSITYPTEVERRSDVLNSANPTLNPNLVEPFVGTIAKQLDTNQLWMVTSKTYNGDNMYGSIWTLLADPSTAKIVQYANATARTAGIPYYSSNGLPNYVPVSGTIAHQQDDNSIWIASNSTFDGLHSFVSWKAIGNTDPVVSYNAQVASYVLQSSDASTSSATKYVTISTASANSLTVNSGLIGDSFNIIQEGTGQTTIYPGVGVTLKGTPGLKLRAQYSAVTLVKQSTDVYYVIGDLSA